MTKLLDYSGLYQLLADLVTKKRTGTILGKTDSNHSVMIGVRDGDIAYLICAGKRGRSAIPEIRKITALTVRLEDSATLLGGRDMPSTAEIMLVLRPWASPEAVSGVSAAPDPHAPHQEADGPKLCDLLSQFLGPIAPVLCSDAIRDAGGLTDEARRQQVILTLAQEIEDEAEAAQFIDRARALFGGG